MDDDQNSPAPDPALFVCPGCNEEVQAERLDTAYHTACPYCSEQMLIPAIDGSTDLPEERMRVQKSIAQDELDGLRIRSLMLARRASIRARTYSLLAVAGCLYLAYLAGDRVVVSFEKKQGMALTVFWIVCAVAGVGYAVQMFLRARRYQKDSRESLLEEPTEPPDFTPLSDGSQYTKNLERVDDGHEERDERSRE